VAQLDPPLQLGDAAGVADPVAVVGDAEQLAVVPVGCGGHLDDFDGPAVTCAPPVTHGLILAGQRADVPAGRRLRNQGPWEQAYPSSKAVVAVRPSHRSPKRGCDDDDVRPTMEV
jgi:hypothetical protein